MKPQTSAFLDKSRELLERADTMLSAGLNEDAGRTAYLAGLHAARAFIFESTGEITKRHARAHGEFARLVKDDPRFDPELRGFLGRTFNLKTLADYETGPGSRVSPKSAREAIHTARRFVATVASLIPANGHTPRAPEAEPKP